MLGAKALAGESTAAIAARVAAAFALQLARQGKANHRLENQEIALHCQLDTSGEQLLHGAMLRLHWSARTYHRVLRVARSIADLAGSATIARCACCRGHTIPARIACRLSRRACAIACGGSAATIA